MELEKQRKENNEDQSESRLYLERLAVQVLTAFYLIPAIMCGLATQNLSLEKACRVNVGFSSDVCDALSKRNSSGYSEDQEAQVQKLVSLQSAYGTIFAGVVPSVMMLFLGSWSDRHRRRKPFILIPIVGQIVTTFCLLVCWNYFLGLSLEYVILSDTVPKSLAGGCFCLFVCVYCYTAERSSIGQRTVSVGSLAIVINASVVLGKALSGVAFRMLSYQGVYGLSIGLMSFSMILGVFFMQEKKTVRTFNGSLIEDLFDFKHVSNTLSTYFKDGPKNRRTNMLVIMLTVFTSVGPSLGEMDVIYYFTRMKFGWGELEFSGFNTYRCVVQIIGSAICINVFGGWMKFDDTVLGIITTISSIIGYIGLSLASKEIYFFIAVLIQMFGGCGSMVVRAIVSKLVPEEELGQINAVIGIFESLMSFVFGFLYNIVYLYTVQVYPGAFFFLSLFFNTMSLFAFIFLYLEHKKFHVKKAEETF